MLKHFILSFFFCSFYLISSQTLSVKDKISLVPIQSVTLSSENPKRFTVTNSEGQVDITDFKESKKIIFQILGYETVWKTYEELKSSGFEVLMNTTTINLDNVVISPTKFVQSSDISPNKVAVISKKDEELYNPQTAADLLQLSGNVFIQKSQQGGGSPMIRGFATNRLIYSVDGVRMNTAIFRGGNIQNVINLDPFAIENTEVMFGPGSVIYGSDAIGGVMSFQTLTPSLSLSDTVLIKGNAASRYSSANNEKTGHLDINIGWKKWALASSFSSWDYGHLRQGRNGPEEYIKSFHVQTIDGSDVTLNQEDPLLQIPSGYKQKNYMQKVRFHANKNLDFQYGFHHSETSEFGRYDRHNRMKDGLPRYGVWSYGPQSWTMHNLSVTHSKRNKIYDQAVLRLANQSFGESRITRDLNAPEQTTRTESVLANSINWDFIKSTGDDNTINYGFEYVENNVNSLGEVLDISSNQKTAGPSRYPNSTWSSMAIYLNNEHDFGDKLIIQTGARINNYMLDAEFDNTFYPFPFEQASINQASLTGNIGAVYRPNKNWVLRGSLASAFRAPNVDDIGKVFDSEPGAVIIPNPDLKAEQAYSLDFGIARNIADRAKIDLTGYYTILENALVQRDYTLNGLDSIIYDGEMSQVQAIQNAAEATVYGIQLSFDFQISDDFKFFSNFTYQQGEEELNDGNISPMRHAPPLFGNGGIKFRKNKLSFSFYSFYQGEISHENLAVSEHRKDEFYAQDENGDNYSPAWYTINCSMSYQLNKNFILSGGIENISNQRYRPYSSGISGAGINFITSVRAKF